MENVTPSGVWAVVASIAAAVVLLANAAEKLVKAVRVAKNPNMTQDKRLDALERHMEQVDKYLAADKQHLEALDEGNRVTQRALLALLEHGIDGNNVKQLETAKNALQDHLINR